jgi:hypothetical protein
LAVFDALDNRTKEYDQEIGREHAANEACLRLGALARMFQLSSRIF